MKSPTTLPSGSFEPLSALVDGELDSSVAATACAQWRDDAGARCAWHRYQLIGDVLRSDELASTAAHDQTFLATLRDRLALEPVVLAPQPLSVPEAARPAPARRSRGGWIGSGTIAAGFVAVAGVLLATRGTQVPDATGAAPTLAAAEPVRDVVPVPVPVPVATGAPVPFVAGEPQPPAASGQMIRDVRLDRYLAAHKQFAGSSALGVPSGLLRNATADAAGR